MCQNGSLGHSSGPGEGENTPRKPSLEYLGCNGEKKGGHPSLPNGRPPLHLSGERIRVKYVSSREGD